MMYYFSGTAYHRIKDFASTELEYDEKFEKIIEAKNKGEAQLILKKELREFDAVEIDCDGNDAIAIPTDNPIDRIPYKNRWGHWVWRRNNVPEISGWPGLKPPNDKVIPKAIGGRWYWV